MALDDELKIKASQFGTEVGGRLFNSQSTDFAPQPFTSVTNGRPYDRGIAPSPTQEISVPGEEPLPSGARVGVPNRPELRPSVMATEAGMRQDYNETRGPSDLSFTPAATPLPEGQPKTGIPEAPATPQGYTNYAPGIDYKLGPENAAGDAAARERIGRESKASEDASRGQDVLNREASVRAKKEGEFDYDKFKETLGSLGGKLPPRLQAQMYQHALTEHGRMQDLKEKAREANLIHGEGSASMIGARSNERHQEIDNQLKTARNPAEIDKLIAEKGEIIAKTEMIPAQIAQYKAHADYLEANSDTPGIKAHKVMLDFIGNQLKETYEPNARAKLMSQADEIGNQMKKDAHNHEMSKKYGLPPNPTRGHKQEITTDAGKKYTVMWNGSSWEEAK